MAYTTNKFCWHGLMSTDTAKSEAFYSEVLGWKIQSADMGGETVTMFEAQGVPLAHYRAHPEPQQGSHWSNYLRVDDVDAATQTALKNGGKIVAEPTDIVPGRFSIVTSPSGAAISLFHEADEATSQHHPGGIGSVHWLELHSKDIDADLQWLKASFGFETSEMPMPQGGTYYILNFNGEPRAGACPTFMPKEAPSMWLPWFVVDDCDAALERVKNCQGIAFTEAMDMEDVGRMAMIADNTGAPLGVIHPADLK